MTLWPGGWHGSRLRDPGLARKGLWLAGVRFAERLSDRTRVVRIPARERRRFLGAESVARTMKRFYESDRFDRGFVSIVTGFGLTGVGP